MERGVVAFCYCFWFELGLHDAYKPISVVSIKGGHYIFCFSYPKNFSGHLLGFFGRNSSFHPLPDSIVGQREY